MAGLNWDDPLAVLQWNWGEAYEIARKGTDEWVAARRDDGGALKAGTPAGLRDRMLADYLSRPVGR